MKKQDFKIIFILVAIVVLLSAISSALMIKLIVPKYEPPQNQLYDDSVLFEEIESVKNTLYKEQEKYKQLSDSLSLVYRSNAAIINNQRKNISKLETKINDLQDNIDYSSIDNDSLKLSITNNIN